MYGIKPDLKWKYLKRKTELKYGESSEPYSGWACANLPKKFNNSYFGAHNYFFYETKPGN